MTTPKLHIFPALACALLLAGCCRPAWADDHAPSAAEDMARDLVDEVLRKSGAGEDGLGDWTRSAIERALERVGRTVSGTGAEADAGRDSSPAPLPAERNAPAFTPARPNTAEVIVFTSLSVPAASWQQWSLKAARIGAPMVLRGVGREGFQTFVKRIGARLGDSGAGAAIDPRLFRLFGIEAVPAVAVVPGGVPPCASRGCADDPAPPHDLVSGNIGLEAALEAVAAEGAAGRETARRHLARLRGEER